MKITSIKGEIVMTKVSENRLLEFCANAGYNASFRLYVREGKPVRIEQNAVQQFLQMIGCLIANLKQ